MLIHTTTHRAASRMKVLVLTHRLPFAPNRGDRVRAFHIVKLLAARADVHVVSLVHDRAEAAEADTLRRMGVRVSIAPVPRIANLARAAIDLGTNRPLTHLLLHSPRMQEAVRRATDGWRPDVVLAYCSGVAPAALAPPLADVPLVLDLVDVDSAKWAAFGEAASFPRSWVFRREARCLAAFEQQAVAAAHRVVVVNEREREALLHLAPDARVVVAPNGVDVERLSPPDLPMTGDRVIFAAVFNYAPNADGALWFAREVWPRIRAARRSARLTLAGASPTRAVRRLADADASIEVTGSVKDIRPFLWGSAVSVAPIFQARGVQNKVLEAAAAGLPAVVTRAVWDGLPQEVLPACQIGETAERFAAEVVRLLALSPTDRRRRAARAKLSGLAWPTRLAPLVDVIESAAADDAPAVVAYAR